MSTVTFKTEKAIFYFDLQDVSASLQEESLLGQNEDAVELATLLEIPVGETINIPKDKLFFRYVALDLLGKGKGSVLCKRCQETYHANEIESYPVGFGENPVRIKIKRKGGILKRIFSRKIKRTGPMGGRGFRCPEGHELVSMISLVA
jgi:hypothetical protein